MEEGIVRELREETGFISLKEPILLGEFMVNPAVQNNKVITFLILDAFKEFEQDLDDTEEINIKLIDFNDMGNLIQSKQINTQLFTAHAYLMAKMYLLENNWIFNDEAQFCSRNCAFFMESPDFSSAPRPI